MHTGRYMLHVCYASSQGTPKSTNSYKYPVCVLIAAYPLVRAVLMMHNEAAQRHTV